MRKKIIACFVILAVAVAFMPVMSFAASKTVKMTVYNQVYKTGNTVYCGGAKGLYKVTLKKGKVKKAKVLCKYASLFGAYSYIGGIKKKGKYIYFTGGSEGTYWTIMRVKTSGKGLKQLAGISTSEYVIKGKKIYYVDYDWDDDEKELYYSMKLNGKSKHRTSTKVKMKTKRSNAAKYSVIMKEYKGYAYDYLKTPKGTFFLGKVLIEESEYWEDDDY